MKRVALLIQYDGSNYSGWQRQKNSTTVQEILERALFKIAHHKVNTFAAVFPISKPQYVLVILLDEPKPSKDYIYHYKDGSGWKYKGTAYNTAGWTSVEVLSLIHI